MMRRRGPLGVCDRCGYTVKNAELEPEYVAGRPSGLRTCRRCWDDDHPQNFLHLIKADDPKFIDNIRPETYNDSGLWGWRPIGNPATYLSSSTGTIRVTTG